MIMTDMAAAAAIDNLDAGPTLLRAPDRLRQHGSADRRDQAVTEQAHACDLGRRATERAAQQQIGKRHDDDRRDHVEDRDLQPHKQAAADPRLARQKVRDHHELAVARSQGMQHAVEECEARADHQGQRALTLSDRAHVLGDQPVGLALEDQERMSERGKRACRPLRLCQPIRWVLA